MRRHLVWWGVIVLVLVAAFVWYITRSDTSKISLESAPVTRGDVVYLVNVTGHAEPLERVTLAFPQGGTVTSVPVNEGDTVMPGDVIARLDSTVAGAQLAQAEAQVRREEAALDELQEGASVEDRAVADASLDRANVARTAAETGLRRAVSHAFVLADDAITEKVDELYDMTGHTEPRFGITFQYGTTRYNLGADALTTANLSLLRARASDVLEQLELLSRAVDVRTAADEAYDELLFLESFVTQTAVAVNRFVPTDLTAQTVYETFQTSITAARTSIETALSEVRAARSEYDTAAASVAVATKERERTNAPARTEAERAQFAQLAVAREAARVIRAQLNERVLTSPIAATVANIYLDPGEAVGALQPVADLLSPSTFELQAFIPEADIAHVKLGDHARVTFDAFDRTAVFNAKVIRISDGETVRDGVPTYKTTFVLTDMPEGAGTLRAGMSADIEIETALHKDVLAVPSRSVIAEGDRTYVRVVTGTDQYEERDVVTGLRGSEGTTEIVSGITASDRVVVFIDGA